MSDGEQLSIHDLKAMLNEVWAKHPKRPRNTITVRPDGFYEDGEATTDDGPLAEGDVVRWDFMATKLLGDNLEPFGGRRPYVLGVVQNADPETCLPDHVGVTMSTGAGGQFPRELLRRDEPQQT